MRTLAVFLKGISILLGISLYWLFSLALIISLVICSFLGTISFLIQPYLTWHHGIFFFVAFVLLGYCLKLTNPRIANAMLAWGDFDYCQERR